MSPTLKIPPKPSKEVIYIDVDDEITSIIDKVEGAKEKVAALVLPKRATMLQSIVNMRLLARAAENAGKNIVLITSEEALLPLAGVAGIHVAKTLQSVPEVPPVPEALAKIEHPAKKAAKSAAIVPLGDEEAMAAGEENLPKKIDYDRSIGELAAVHEADNPETIALDDDEEEPAEKAKAAAAKVPKDKKLKVPNFDRFRLMLGLGALAFIALIVFIFLALFILPKATIAIQTTSTPVVADLSATTSGSAKALDEKNKIIPSVSKTSDQTASTQVTATGQQNNGAKAKGTVTMSAGSCSATVPSSVPKGTGVSSSGLTYITQESVSFTPTVHGAQCTYQGQTSTGSSNVDIVAQNGGAKYNVPSASFAVAGRSDVAATGSASDGTDNIQTILSQSDVDGAKSKITSASSDTYSKTFESQLASQGYYVFTSTLKISDPVTTATPDVGQPATTSNVTIKVTYTVLAVQKADLSKFITDQMNGQIDKTKQKLSTNLLNDASITIQSQASPTDATLAIHEDTTAVPIIDVNGVKNLTKGKKSGVITSTIGAWPGVKSVDVKLSPFWVSKVPSKSAKITVILKEVKPN